MSSCRPVSISAAPAFTDLNNLASAEFGAQIVFATDDWFAVAENLLKTEAPEWRERFFTPFGKWMDGWETRRKRTPSHDWCIIKLGVPGIIMGLDINTMYFTGNYPPRVSIQAATLAEDEEFPERTSEMGSCASEEQMEQIRHFNSEDWQELVPMSTIKSGHKETCHNYFPVNNNSKFTHVRLNLFPDGGIAKLRVYGVATKDWTKLPPDKMVDLVAMVNGGRAVAWSNKHYGHPRNLIAPGRAPNMGSGWETARRLDRPPVLRLGEDGCLDVPGNEWAVVKLGHPGVVIKVEVDTNHFKGNFPDSCILEGCILCDEEEKLFTTRTEKYAPHWRMLLPRTKLSPHKRHFYTTAVKDCGTITHARITIFPDGGVSRLRLLGYPRKLIKQYSESKL